MMHLRRVAPTAWVIISLFVITGTAFAQGKSAEAKARHFGIGQPKSVQEIPHGNFRNRLENLSPNARGKALEWLKSFEFPAEDVNHLHVNEFGDISYVDMFETDPTARPAEASKTASVENIDPDKVFLLHSRPGASNVVFLDFDGHTIEGTAWSSVTLEALPFDPSGNDNPPTQANFTQEELNTIHEIWHRVSEDFAPFNIDVTTEEPAVFTPTTGRILFTHYMDASGQAMPSSAAGGISYVNVFGRSDYATRYSPALIYYTNLANRSAGLLNYNAEVASHEFGHNIGLGHDGSDSTEYYPGLGNGLVSWGPIMGNMLDKNVTQWSKGEYPNANNTEDDIMTLHGDLGYAADDHGDSAESATALRVEANGDILVSNPEIDPDNLVPDNKGIIDGSGDVDWFYLDVQEPGSIEIMATPAWHAFYRDDSRGGNLDIELVLLSSDLDILAIDDPDNDTSASVSASVEPGRYYLQVDGVGNSVNSDYSDYASLGMYFIEGTVSAVIPPEPEPDTTPPTPSTMSWETRPHALDSSSISMTAVLASDESGVVEYYFTCVAGDPNCQDSNWQSDRTFTVAGLSADTYYEFRVRARDAAGNENAGSVSAGTRTQAEKAPNLAPQAVASYSPAPAVITRGNTVEVTLDGSGSSDFDGDVVSWVWQAPDGLTVCEDNVCNVKLSAGTYIYVLTVTDNEGASGTTNLSFEVKKEEKSGGRTKPPKK
jgi:hypothetical protein